ncbi:hypothetical protein NHX12_033855 [Muraenolepis orangiensis]|uniref:Calponin-homology (CH) domain-containing protein n=1 Tax=Muraenolepis orangiensis TaxID=630683 RepID=A0A9Q0E466_9TELE|nr:hypothetical protein NHX12_033855 [Muraenolepis orangiensis]
MDLAKSKKRKSDECQEKQSHRLHVRKNALWRGHNGTIRFSPLYSSIVNEDGKSSGSCNQSVNLSSDERWIEKQESGFTCWINYILTPDDFRVNLEVTKVNALSIAMGSEEKYSVPKAPTKEELSFSTYTARRRSPSLEGQKGTAESPQLAAFLQPPVVTHRTGDNLLIPLESNSDLLGLAMFILTRLLWNPDIAIEFRHGKVPHLYKDVSCGHEEALSRFTLKKLLLFVSFLDKAKESRLIEHDPCLFCMDAEFKTSKDLLLAFSRDFLSGEGILPRHMGYLGLPVSHVQTPLDEFNFGVKNLAVDLKCGIRLVRVMELFLQDWSLSRRLHLPAISRLQKVHNVDIAFQVLKDKGVDLRDEHGTTTDSRDIVDGHREKTLSLLWKIIFAFQSHWRSLVQRLAYQRLREVAITLQRILRSVLLARAAKSHYTRKRRAAVTIQAHFRGWIARRNFLEAAMAEKRLRFCATVFHHISAIKIQRALRVHWALKSAKKEIHSVIAIQYHKTVEAVYAVENCVETLLDLLQRYRDKAGDKVADKGGSIFTKACFLLALLLQDRHWALEVSKLPKALDRIRSIYHLTARKYRMDTERTIVKHKMNASTNSGFSVQATPRKSRPPRRFAPDWVLKKDKLRDVVDPLGAIQMVADTFSIVL